MYVVISKMKIPKRWYSLASRLPRSCFYWFLTLQYSNRKLRDIIWSIGTCGLHDIEINFDPFPFSWASPIISYFCSSIPNFKCICRMWKSKKSFDHTHVFLKKSRIRYSSNVNKMEDYCFSLLGIQSWYIVGMYQNVTNGRSVRRRTIRLDSHIER